MAEKFEYTREWTDAEAFPLLGFTKSWENPEDYPTIELDETQVRKDMQSLHDEVKNYINDKLIPAVLAEDATEAARAAAEAQRETNENQRIENENARIAAEQDRVDETNGVVAQANQAAQSWAVGGTGTREGEDTNNAKYWSDKAREAAGGDFVPTSEKGTANGVATLGADALLAAAQRPKAGGLYRDDGTTTVEASLAEISTTLQKKADSSSVYTKEESISAETRTTLSLAETATPDDALAKIAQKLSERITLLWENASPASQFFEQSIAINSLQNYDFVLVDYQSSGYGANGGCAICSTRVNAAGVMAGYIYGSYWFDVARNFVIKANSISFGNSYSYGFDDGGSKIAEQNSGYNVPMKIYGIKA